MSEPGTGNGPELNRGAGTAPVGAKASSNGRNGSRKGSVEAEATALKRLRNRRFEMQQQQLRGSELRLQASMGTDEEERWEQAVAFWVGELRELAGLVEPEPRQGAGCPDTGSDPIEG